MTTPSIAVPFAQEPVPMNRPMPSNVVNRDQPAPPKILFRTCQQWPGAHYFLFVPETAHEVELFFASDDRRRALIPRGGTRW